MTTPTVEAMARAMAKSDLIKKSGVPQLPYQNYFKLSQAAIDALKPLGWKSPEDCKAMRNEVREACASAVRDCIE